MLLLRLLASDFRVAVAGFFSNFVTKLRLKPPSNAERSVRESSLLGGRCAAAKTASKASPAKTCFISSERGFRRCLVGALSLFLATPADAQFKPRAISEPATGEKYHIEAEANL